ncbi:MAG: MBL fold metallo-hydrolase [Peptococcaceae bacterium]|jgi:glyoxylase-like metal-dependent hydrolase (beta-lactamase superfamily II)/rhodanese-related sulfurtransferase|nr:MBL fold metallo-hydrolase [Peptococcaceae bacterium]
MFFEQIKTPGLGCFSYIIGSPEAGVMAVFDPRRDIDIYLRISEEYGMRVTHIFETHVHADHVSGAQALRAATGADICIHESAAVTYEAKKLSTGDEFVFGDAAVLTLHTPGHTPHSVSFLVTDLVRSTEPEMILTGDLLFVGDVGRPDLAGEELLADQVEDLYDSLYKVLSQLPGYLEVYPAHGQGSLCGHAMSDKPFTTLGYERLANPMLRFHDFDQFKYAILLNLPMQPQSFTSIIAANLQGAAILQELGGEPFALTPDQADEFLKAGAELLDLRDALSYSEAHIPGSVNVDFSGGPQLNWVGMAVPPGKPLVLALPADEGFEDVCIELRRIGYDAVKGWLKGGIPSWAGSGRAMQVLPYISVPDLRARLDGPNPPAVYDVRTIEEFAYMKIEGAVNLTIDRIAEQGECPVSLDAEVVIVCQSGFRAGIAASMLQARGCAHVFVLAGGMEAWQQA